MRDAVVTGREGIGAEVPSDKSSVRCKGSGGPLIWGIKKVGGGSCYVEHIDALPFVNLYTIKYVKRFSSFKAAPVAIARPPNAFVDF
jgi:hypothetical protein